VIQFRVGERDPGQPRQVRDLVTGDGHAGNLMAGTRMCGRS
jgi:hypothetical protein